MKLYKMFFLVKGMKNRKVSAPLVKIALIILLQLERTMSGGRDQTEKLYSNEREGEGDSLFHRVTNCKGLQFRERAFSRMFSPIAPRLKITGTVNEQLNEFFRKLNFLKMLSN